MHVSSSITGSRKVKVGASPDRRFLRDRQVAFIFNSLGMVLRINQSMTSACEVIHLFSAKKKKSQGPPPLTKTTTAEQLVIGCVSGEVASSTSEAESTGDWVELCTCQ